MDVEASRVWRDRIRDVLNQEWDPIGGCPPDEYDMYIDEIANMLRFDKTDDNLLKYLEWAAAINMGLSRTNTEHDRKVVKSLRKLGVPNET